MAACCVGLWLTPVSLQHRPHCELIRHRLPGDVVWTALERDSPGGRAQFHDALLLAAEALAKLPVMLVLAGFRFLPVGTGEVANG
jgi:hypothetical protein